MINPTRLGNLIPLLLALVAASLLGACGGGDSDSNGDGDATETATTAPDDGDLFDGKTVAEFYTINCSACHGPNREGIVGPGLTPDLLVDPDDAFYVETILDGRPGTVMPPWAASGVSQAEAEALVAFFRTAP